MAELKPFDFALFTDAQLLDLARQAEREILRRKLEARRLAREAGQVREADPPRYRNPMNPAQTWSGRGSEPAWVAFALASGLSLTDLECNDNRPEPK